MPICSSTLRRLFGIDPRSLALFRISAATLLLADLATRATDLNVMYSDDGMFPRMEICRLSTSIWNWSFHFASGSPTIQALFFGLAGILALALLLGFETRLATIGSWLMLVSLHHRVPPILSGADILLRMLLFWAMFLPLERAWSIDRRLLQGSKTILPRHDEEVCSIASAAILLQLALMYFCSAIFKSNADWISGEAIAGSLRHNFYASPFGAFLLHFPRMLKVLTWATFILEWIGPLLLFFPKSTARLRMFIVAALAAMHLGIALFLEVDLFSPVALAGLCLFLPAQFWNNRLFVRFFPVAETDKVSAPGPSVRTSFAFLGQALCAVFMVYVLAVNLSNLPGRPLGAFAPEKWKPLAMTFGLGQRWAMFASIPSNNGWYVARAKLTDGSEVDLLRHGAPITWEKPDYPAGIYPNYRWRKLFREMAYADDAGYQLLRPTVAEFLCRNWNSQAGPEKRVLEFELIYCHENPAGEKAPPPARERLVHLDYTNT